MDTFIYILAGLSLLLILIGCRYLFDRSLEIGALVGIYPIMWGVPLGVLATILWCIQHLSIHTV